MLERAKADGKDTQQNTHSIVLLGDSGAGKSTFMGRLWSLLAKEWKDGRPIPLLIPLPQLSKPLETAVEEALEKALHCDWNSFSSEEQQALRDKEFIFLFDAFDELGRSDSLYEKNKLGQWKFRLMVVTCRAQYLNEMEEVDWRNCFQVRKNGRRAGVLEERYVSSVSKGNVEGYVKAYTARVRRLGLPVVPGWEEPKTFLEALEKIPDLYNLIRTP